MAEHIKWQKTANKKYFGSWDLPDDGKDMIVTIEDVKREMVQNQQGSEEHLVLHFKGDFKPMILNTTNKKNVAKACGTDWIDEWVGKKIQLYQEIVTAFGETGPAVRIRDFAPDK